MTTTQEDHDFELAVKSSLIVLFCLGILGMLYFVELARHQTDFSDDEHNEDEEEGNKIKKEISVYFLHRLQLILLGIFAIGSVGFDLLKIVDIGQCIHQINKDLDLKRTSLVGVIIKLFFELGQIFFIAHFWTYRCRSNITQFILGLIFAANLCIWIDVLVSESLVNWTQKSMNTDHNYTNSSNSTPCETGSTKTSEMIESWQPYLYPLTIEFVLMASALSGSMWGWNIKRKTVVNDNSANQSTEYVDLQSETAQQPRREEVSLSDNNQTIQSTSPLNTQDGHTVVQFTEESYLVGSQPNVNRKHDKTRCRLTNRTCPAVFYLAILLSITLFFLAVANQGELWLGYCWLYMFFHLSLLLSSVFACYKMRQMETQPVQFGANQILLLFSSGALLLMTLLELIPPLSMISSLYGYEKLLIATDFFLLIYVFFQTSMLFKRYQIPDFENQYLRKCFSWIAVLNLYMWFEDSIFSQRLDWTLYLKRYEFYDPMVWTVCKLILMPPSIFYRIHVAQMFGERLLCSESSLE
ncbi:hypothetical protein ACJMK2_023863 [Sinanodonta woodiana]|uniref:Uncharacterized protein n=1 Tax=Sinanodonta woodiana TaxID=1069815 RepID=A0ABD3T5L9_SINWO